MKPSVKIFLPLMGGIACLLAACGHKAAEPAPLADTTNDTLSHILPAEADTSLYGRSIQAGMSTFCLLTDAGDTLLLTRTDEEGHEGRLVGSNHLGDRFAVLTADEGEALRLAINLSQVDLFVPHYKVVNGRLVLSGPDMERSDTVSILFLNADSMAVEDAAGVRSLAPLARKAGE